METNAKELLKIKSNLKAGILYNIWYFVFCTCDIKNTQDKISKTEYFDSVLYITEWIAEIVHVFEMKYDCENNKLNFGIYKNIRI